MPGIINPFLGAASTDVTLRDVDLVTITSAATLVLPQPTGLVAGDIMVVYTQHNNTSSLTGWTSLRTSSNSGVNVASNAQSWWRVATSGDVSAWSHSITYAGTFSGIAVISTWYNCTGVEASSGVGGNNNTTLNEGAYTTLTNNARILHMASTRNSQTPPSVNRGTDVVTGFVDGPLSGGDFGLRMTTEIQAVAGAATVAGMTGGGNGKEFHAAVLTRT